MTFALGAKSLAQLDTVHADLARVVKRAIGISAQDFTVYEGARTLEKQRENVRRGVSRTMNSRHLVHADGTGHAVDLVPWVDGRAQWLWGGPHDLDAAGQRVGGCYAIAAAMREAAELERVALVWGGVWDRRLSELPADAGAIAREVVVYMGRHPGSDLLDGPHFELAGG